MPAENKKTFAEAVIADCNTNAVLNYRFAIS